MGIEPIAVHNEPLARPRGDRFPKGEPVPIARLNRVVRARLELERELRVCGNRPIGNPLRITQAHVRVLLAMLAEVDSPLAASLRARAAGAAGPMKLERAAPVLRKMALDEEEDLHTRLNAAASYIELRKHAAAGDVSTLLESKDTLIRATVYVAALKSGDPRLTRLAEARYERENDRSVRRQVALRVPRLSPETHTRDDA